jgi:hypothetical protein
MKTFNFGFDGFEGEKNVKIGKGGGGYVSGNCRKILLLLLLSF